MNIIPTPNPNDPINLDDLLLSIQLEKRLLEEWALVPGNNGQDCPGNGVYTDAHGNPIGLLCDECDYLICCTNCGDMCDKCFAENGACPEDFLRR